VLVTYGTFLFKGVLAGVEIDYSKFDNAGTKDHAIVRFVVRGASAALNGSR
jgi:hypothetical protein